MTLARWIPRKEFFSHPNYPGVVVDCSSSVRLVRAVSFDIDTCECQVGRAIFRSSTLVGAFRFVEAHFRPVSTEQVMIKPTSASVSFRAIVGLALSQGVGAWRWRDRVLRAYFLTDKQRQLFIKLASERGVYAAPNDQSFTVRGCPYSAIVRY